MVRNNNKGLFDKCCIITLCVVVAILCYNCDQYSNSAKHYKSISIRQAKVINQLHDVCAAGLMGSNKGERFSG